MNSRVPEKRDALRRLFSAASGIAVAVSLLSGLASAPRILAQTPQTKDAPLPSFEVASIKPSASGESRQFTSFGDPSRFAATYMTVKGLIELAYHLTDFEVSGG